MKNTVYVLNFKEKVFFFNNDQVKKKLRARNLGHYVFVLMHILHNIYYMHTVTLYHSAFTDE